MTALRLLDVSAPFETGWERFTRSSECEETEIITVAIVEDNRLLREGITDMLNGLHDVEVVLSATGSDVMRLKRAKPRVVLLDIAMRETKCLCMAETLRRELADAHVVVMDLAPANDGIADLVNAGVAGFILNDATVDDFVGTIRAVAAGTRVLPPRMTESLFAQIARVAWHGRSETAVDAAAEVRMTQRERQMISLIALGLSNKEIAERVGIATDTVKSHVRNVMDKLALHTRLQIAAYAHQRAD